MEIVILLGLFILFIYLKIKFDKRRNERYAKFQKDIQINTDIFMQKMEDDSIEIKINCEVNYQIECRKLDAEMGRPTMLIYEFIPSIYNVYHEETARFLNVNFAEMVEERISITNL